MVERNEDKGIRLSARLVNQTKNEDGTRELVTKEVSVNLPRLLGTHPVGLGTEGSQTEITLLHFPPRLHIANPSLGPDGVDASLPKRINGEPVKASHWSTDKIVRIVFPASEISNKLPRR